MSRVINKAVNQVRLTNVALVRYKTHGYRFEIACYKNKVLNWRNKVETDLQEVLQSEAVYLNVSKGQLASAAQLKEAFGNMSVRDICILILEKGELQVSDGERDHMLESTFKDVATMISEMCVNPSTQRPYPVSTIEQALHDVHFSLKPNKPVKRQALEVIPQLKKLIPLQRAQMRIKFTIATGGNVVSFRNNLQKEVESKLVIAPTKEDSISFEILCDPSHFRTLDEYVKKWNGMDENEGTPVQLELIDFAVHEQGEADVEEIDFGVGGGGMMAGFSSKQSSKVQKEEDDEEEEEMTSSKSKSKKNSKKKGKKGQGDDEEEIVSSSAAAAASRAAARSEVKKNAISVDDTSSKVKLEGQSCSTCGVSFGDDRNALRDHHRTEWHRYNLKLKMISLPHVTQKEFEAMTATDRDAILNAL